MMNPGSDEAISEGCTCPVLENRHGNGYKGMAGVFVYNSGCPVHKDERVAKYVAEMNQVWPEYEHV